MYCPNCSTKVWLDQKFCRACGLGLEKIAQSLSEQHPTELDESLQAQKNKLERAGMIALSIFGLGVFGFFVFMVGYKLMLSKGAIIAALGVIGFIVFMGCGLLAAMLFAKANEVKEAANKRPVQGSDALQKPGITNNLLSESKLEPVASVTERTTDLLFVQPNLSKKPSTDYPDSTD